MFYRVAFTISDWPITVYDRVTRDDWWGALDTWSEKASFHNQVKQDFCAPKGDYGSTMPIQRLGSSKTTYLVCVPDTKFAHKSHYVENIKQ